MTESIPFSATGRPAAAGLPTASSYDELEGALDFYASWGRRFVAWAIDGVTVVVLESVASLAVGAAGPPDSLATVAVVVVPVAYYVVFTGSKRGQTLGKRSLGIAVRRRTSLGRLGYGRAAVRWLATAILWLLFIVPGLIDGLWPVGDRENRSLHDLVAGSVVVRV